MKLATLILAAGNSSRMRTPKQLLQIGETTLLGKVIQLVSQVHTDQVFCVLGANAEKINESIENQNVELIFNSEYEQGLASSIKVGIQHISQLGFEAILILLGDQPNIEVSYLNVLIETYKTNKDSIIASKYDDKKGVPAIFPKIYFNDLLNLTGDKGAGKLLNDEDYPTLTLDLEVDLFDVDTKEDYQTLLKQ